MATNTALSGGILGQLEERGQINRIYFNMIMVVFGSRLAYHLHSEDIREYPILIFLSLKDAPSVSSMRVENADAYYGSPASPTQALWQT
jgi:hypothetical protein